MQQECGNASSSGRNMHKSWDRRDRATKLPYGARTNKVDKIVAQKGRPTSIPSIVPMADICPRQNFASI